MSARDELRVMLAADGHWPGPIEQKLDAHEAEVLRKAVRAVEDPEQRLAASGYVTSLGWESARDVLNGLIRNTEAGER